MKLLHLSTTKDCFGVIDVTVRVNGKKEYTFSVTSQHDVDTFLEQLHYHPGKALNYLKKVKINSVATKHL